MTKLQRTTFKTSRAAQYVEARALQAMTGQSKEAFREVVIKELMDNALDACETARVAPEVTLELGSDGAQVHIAVTDNGPGIPTDTVHGALDFDKLVSDKAAYRSPTRGAQGNALKTVFGIPHALGALEPVVIEAGKERHAVRVWKDPAGELREQCDDTVIDPSFARQGTRVRLTLPLGLASGEDLTYWGGKFALFNPHAAVRISMNYGEHVPSDHGYSGGRIPANSYRPTRDPAKRFKYLPSDPTSAHWYDTEAFKRLVYSHIGHARGDGEDIYLRDFVRQFKGLSSTSKAKAVCDAFPDIKTLSDFEKLRSEEQMADLLEGMKLYSDAPSTATLGYVGKEHFQARFENFYEFYGGLNRFGYKKITGTLPTGLPYVFEFAIAELEGAGGDLFTAVNFSPTFGDPLQDSRFAVKDGVSGTGVDDFLDECFAHPHYDHDDDPGGPCTAVAVHIVTPAPLFLDQGKTRLEGFDSESVRQEIAAAMFSQLKPYFKEGKRRVRSQRSRERQQALEEKGTTQMSLKDAAAAVLEDAWKHTTGDGSLPVGVRRLFYAVRSRIPAVTDRRFNPERGYKYFSQTLLPEYQAQREAEGKGRLEGIYYDPRGKLHEPHGGAAVDLGTREVEAYEFPAHVFNKLLYVEKKGQIPLLKAARISELYDMGIVTGEGFSTVAARTLIQSAQKDEDYQIFVLHDADYAGYNIVRTLRDETARMPGYSVEVYDLGLTVAQVLEKGFEPEEYERSSAIPSGLLPLLDAEEEEWFVGEPQFTSGEKDVYLSKRFELDDLSAPETIDHIKERMKELGVEPKLIPPEEFLADERVKLYREQVRGWVDNVIADLLGTAELKEKMVEEFQERFKLQGAEAWIKAGFKRDDTQSWRDALKATLGAAYEGRHEDDFRSAVREYIRETVGKQDDEEDDE